MPCKLIKYQYGDDGRLTMPSFYQCFCTQKRAMSLLSIFNSEVNKIEHSTVIKFLGRLILFLFPLFLIVAAIETVWWRAGDAWPVELALGTQLSNADETLYGRGYFSQQFGIYKLAGIRHKSPKILAIGSSRVMQIRDFMFRPLDKDFYNAGGLLLNAFDLSWLANAFYNRDLPVPKVLIVGIDPWWLRANRGGGRPGLLIKTRHFALLYTLN